jgi:hypothetical protein
MGYATTGAPQTFTEQMTFWGRWVAVVPAGILAALIISFPLHWTVMMMASGSEDDGTLGLSDLPPETLERWGMAFFLPMAFIVAGAKVAPQFKLQTAVGLMLLLAIVLSASTTYVATNNLFAYEGWGWLEFILVICLWFGGAISGLHYVNNELNGP